MKAKLIVTPEEGDCHKEVKGFAESVAREMFSYGSPATSFSHAVDDAGKHTVTLIAPAPADASEIF